MLRIYKCDHLVMVGDAPVGLIELEESGEIICKSEYKNTQKQCDCIIVSSGENYCGGDEKLGWPLIIN